MKRFLALALSTALFVGATASIAAAAEKTVTLKFANVTSQSAKEAGVRLIEQVKKDTDGTLILNHFPDNMLGDDRVAIEQTVFGDIDIASSSTSPLATMFNDFYMFDAPFLFLTPVDAYTALDGELGQQILKDMEKKGLKGLAFWENGFRNFTNSKVAARLPDDVKGMKIRTMENEVHLAAWKAFGANPTPMAFQEVFTALQQGTIDGQENPLGIIDANKFYEVQKYFSITQHVYTPYIYAMNLDKFNSLSERQQNALVKAFKEVTHWQRQRSQELEKEIIVRLAEKGQVIELDPAEKKVWQDKVMEAKVYDIVKKKMSNPGYLDAALKK